MKINQKRKQIALAKIEELMDDAKNVLLIHYSCESFYDRPDGSSPKITSIAIRNLNDGQTRCFSIHKEAELAHINIADMEQQYVNLEKSMLNKFYEYVKQNEGKTFVHWNMRDENYGFGAIELRFQILGGNPVKILDDKKIDLARLLVDIYGVGYIQHPRLQKLIELNHITHADFLSGEQEAEAFKNKNYIALHRSTSRKVDAFANIIGRIQNRNLKTNTSYWQQNGGTIISIFKFFNSNPVIGGTIAISTVISALIYIIKSIF